MEIPRATDACRGSAAGSTLLLVGGRAWRHAHRVRSSSWSPPDLSALIAVVTGASRGVGRGIAEALGQCGATVYVTGRSVRGSTTEDLPGTIDETAEAVTVGGGTFWEQSLTRWDRMFDAGVRAHYTASRLAVPLMLPQQRGLIVNTSYGDERRRLANLIYDVAKLAVDRMAAYMADELREHGIAAVALHPGFTRTELVLRYYGGDPGGTDSPLYVGRAVAALAGDAKIMTKSGRALAVDDVASEYGFADPA
jgi:NAD(P)-dependent dehydrogenase (short-subunit alcohol dehydrogenase family)